MVVNDLSGKEVMIVGFGGVTLLTLVILASIYVGHTITQSSTVQQPIHVSAAAPKIEVNVPQGPAPRVEVTSAVPKVDVHVPQGPAPIINVTTPPATVTVMDKREQEKTIEKIPEKNKIPAPLISPAPTPVQPVPVSAPTDKASENKEINFESLYSQAERYIASYCQKNNLDTDNENKKWLVKWNGLVETAVRDGLATDEQSYINRVVVDKRDCFDLEKATPDKIVEGCRLMLRYRDAKLTWLQQMKSAATAENIQKTMTFLAAGVK